MAYNPDAIKLMNKIVSLSYSMDNKFIELTEKDKQTIAQFLMDFIQGNENLKNAPGLNQTHLRLFFYGRKLSQSNEQKGESDVVEWCRRVAIARDMATLKRLFDVCNELGIIKQQPMLDQAYQRIIAAQELIKDVESKQHIVLHIGSNEPGLRMYSNDVNYPYPPSQGLSSRECFEQVIAYFQSTLSFRPKQE
ncbi:MAG: hypothetical protein A3F11_07810 [Gammaproteobacteria bacterium RIFCSPHIGHO2_12_FULL_37_14]|nr:MAG: hypothetical protein A3F11_07810 [Gammaproteobacteria bacterium RIFCSPHIGHO2_12_FULL_37_14]